MDYVLFRRFFWFITVVFVCGVTSCSTGGFPTGSDGETDGMRNFAFELVTFVPWAENGLQDNVVYSSKLGADGPVMVTRHPPRISLGSDGTLWLNQGKKTVRVRDTKLPEAFVLDTAGIEALKALVPTSDAGMVLVGREGPDVVLARLSGTGDLVWRRLNEPLLAGNLDRVRLLADLDGSVYLYIQNHLEGQIARIGWDDGAVKITTELTHAPETIWLRGGSLFWTIYSDGMRAWVSQAIETGRQQAVAGQGLFQSSLGQVCAPLPEGGALVSTEHTLMWMGPDGAEVDRLTLAGAARSAGGIAVGLREGDVTLITQWKDGKEISSVRVEALPRTAHLIYTDQDGYYMLDRTSDVLSMVDFNGNVTTVTPFSTLNRLRLQQEGRLLLGSAIVDSDGVIFIAGSDPDGAYIVKIAGMPRH